MKIIRKHEEKRTMRKEARNTTKSEHSHAREDPKGESAHWLAARKRIKCYVQANVERQEEEHIPRKRT